MNRTHTETVSEHVRWHMPSEIYYLITSNSAVKFCN